MKLWDKNTMAVFLLLVVVVCVSIPLLYPGFPVTDDGTWMIIRLSAFYQSLSEGQFPVRFLGRLNNSYGYPVANFLYPGFLYIGSLIHLFGFSFVDSVKIIIIFSIAGSTLALYFWLRRDFKTIPSFVGALSFLLSPYLIFYIYKRGSVGEIIGLFFASAFLLFFSYSRLFLAALSLALMIVSHNTLSLIFFIAFLYLYSRNTLRQFLSVTVSGLLMSIFFWGPALIERRYVRFDNVVVSEYSQYFTDTGYGYLFPFAIVFVWLVMRKEIFHVIRHYMFVTLSFLFLSLSVSGVFWKIDEFARLIQFPYRLLPVAVIIGSYTISAVIDKLSKTTSLILALFVLGLTAVQSMPILRSATPEIQPEGYYTTNEATTTVKDEYMPVWVKELPKNRSGDRFTVLSGSSDTEILKQNSSYIDATIISYEESLIEMQTVYYPGWSVVINGVKQPVSYDNQFGFIRFTTPPGQHRMQAAFRETPVRFFLDSISFISCILSGYMFTKYYKIKKVYV